MVTDVTKEEAGMVLYLKETISDIGRIKIEKNIDSDPCELHRHEFIEFVYIAAGKGVHVIDGREYEVSRGNLLFIDYGQSHSIRPDTSMTIFNILLEPEFFSRELINAESIVEIFRYSMFPEFPLKPQKIKQCVCFDDQEAAKTDFLAELMLQEYEKKEQGYLSVLRSCTQSLFTWFLRKMNADRELPVNDSLKEVIEYINQHFTEKMQLSDIAARGFYNPDYLSNLLKKSCGKSYTQYVKEKRITKAAELLRTTELSVNEVMAESGYTDSKIFYQHFKEIHGVTPGGYRR